jgi:hypothetical protein
MKTKHTKGEWTFENKENPAHSIVISTPKFPLGIATVYGGHDGLANAKLIAAAPELLEALNEVLAFEKRCADKGCPVIGNGILSIIHKAIKKATE